MFKKIALVFVSLIVIVVVIIALQSPTFSVARSATIAAPGNVVFTQVNDFHAWNAWSPWAKLDPNCKYTFGDPSAGPGATYSWAGNDQVGEGKMTILESKPGELVRIKLEFLKPMAQTNETRFDFKPEGAGTHVTWTMSGDKNFLSKAFCMFVDMDTMVGGDFEKGLAGMKEIAEKPATAPTTSPTAPTTSPTASAK